MSRLGASFSYYPTYPRNKLRGRARAFMIYRNDDVIESQKRSCGRERCGGKMRGNCMARAGIATPTRTPRDGDGVDHHSLRNGDDENVMKATAYLVNDKVGAKVYYSFCKTALVDISPCFACVADLRRTHSDDHFASLL